MSVTISSSAKLDLNPNNKSNFSHLAGSTHASSSNPEPRVSEVPNDDLKFHTKDSEAKQNDIDYDSLMDDAPALDAYSLFAQSQINSHTQPSQLGPRRTDQWTVSRLRVLPNELRHMVYKSILIRPQTFSIIEAALNGPFVTICDTYPEIEEGISQDNLRANSENEVYCLPWRISHLFIPQTTEFKFATRAVRALDQPGYFQLDDNELAIWDAFTCSSPLINTIRHFNVELEVPPSTTIISSTLNDSIYNVLAPLLDGLKYMPFIEQLTIEITSSNPASFSDFDDGFVDLSFIIWDMFWRNVDQKHYHPGYCSSRHQSLPEIRFVVADSASGDAVLDEVLPGKYAAADPVQYPWYDTDCFED